MVAEENKGLGLRIAFFPDSFYEVNGVALTSRQLQAFASRRGLPFLCVHAGPETRQWTEGSVTTFQLQRGSAAFPLDQGLYFDPLLWQHAAQVTELLRVFQPDVIHVTGPSDIGMIGAALAHRLRVPLAASWHTNLHEYAGRRLTKFASFLPELRARKVGDVAEQGSLWATSRFYQLARILLAPNQELIDLLRQRTGRDCYLMRRGVDTELYSPAKRTRTGGPLRLGYVGRLTPEKNVRFLADIEQMLLAAGVGEYEFLIVGQGSEVDWLSQTLRNKRLTGVLKGEELASAYADMDVFVFPSSTDTYGNVVQEALASGVPAVVTNGGGPKYLVAQGETGFICGTDTEFLQAVLRLQQQPELRLQLGRQARQQALTWSWDSVFEDVYRVYGIALAQVQAATPASST